MKVTAETLLEGSWFALEQAGRLLGSAVILFQSGDFSTATGVAMLGREELGRYKILRKLAQEVAEGRSLSAEQIQTTCNDHERKQQAALLSITIRTQPGTGLNDALRRRLHAAPGSAEWREADRMLEDATDRKAKRLAEGRHQLRTNSFYVDIQEDGLGWKRPQEITERIALDAINEAVGDYVNQRDRLLLLAIDPEMTRALHTMRSAPELPEPQWPEPSADAFRDS